MTHAAFLMFKQSLLFALLASLTLTAASPKQQMLDELHFIKGVFEIKYAPLKWKEKYAGFNLDQKIGEATSRVKALQNPGLQEYHYILKDFFNATKDYHVGVNFYATEEASLPFLVKGAEGRFFFVDIDRSALPLSSFPFSVGDEILLFDGHPVGEAIAMLRERELGANSEKTDQALAEMMLTIRRAANGDLVPSGRMQIVGVRQESDELITADVEWCYFPERVQGLEPVWRHQPNFAAWRLNPRETVKNEKFFDKLMVYSGWYGSHVGCSLSENKHSLGARSSFIPSLGKRIWSAKKDAIFDAYIFHVNDDAYSTGYVHDEEECLWGMEDFSGAGGHNIGYIRIPHYMCDEEEVTEFCKVMKRFERNTDAVVIDQINNPGGSLFYLYALVAALTGQEEIATPKHRLTLTQGEVYMAISILDALEGVEELEEAKEVIGETLAGYPITLETVQLMRQFCDFILEQWSSGKVFTDPTHLFGVDKIRRHPAGAYTKPLLLLINALDFSGGDFLPAILQDAGRATILGTRTAGAGGFVNGTQYPNKTGVCSFNVTGSIAERVDHRPIENLGVQPDVEYELSVFDVQHNYAEYADKIVETLLSIL